MAIALRYRPGEVVQYAGEDGKSEYVGKIMEVNIRVSKDIEKSYRICSDIGAGEDASDQYVSVPEARILCRVRRRQYAGRQ